jgi:hypothetical protein
MWRRACAFPMLALLVGCASTSSASGISGTFRLPKYAFGVGEPIVIEFTVANGSSSDFAFWEGGDYRGTLRHEQFSFRVVSAEGRDFTRELWGNLGGECGEIRLEPGQWFRSSQLLNGWIHLLPPGQYRVHCERKLSPDPWPESAERQGGLTIRQDLSFYVMPYSRDRIVTVIAALLLTDDDLSLGSDLENGEVRDVIGVPVEWAVDDLADTFGILGGEDEVLSGLPEAWDDRYFIGYDFWSHGNLVPRGEGIQLTFSARNNGTVEIAHRLAESTLTVNDVPVPTWVDTMKRMLAERNVGEALAPGAVVELTGTFEILPDKGAARIVWNIGGIRKSAAAEVADPGVRASLP